MRTSPARRQECSGSAGWRYFARRRLSAGCMDPVRRGGARHCRLSPAHRLHAARAAHPNKELSELWVQPEPGRDLFWGVGGKRLAPDPGARYTVIEIKRSGFSRGYTMKDQGDREWSAKFPPEAPTEVVASRILWGVGYHQPPIYYVAHGTPTRATSPNPQLPARFREKKPDLHGLDAKERVVVLPQPVRRHAAAHRACSCSRRCSGNSDLKDTQNAIYDARRHVRRREDVVRRARSRADLRPHRRARRAARRYPGLRADPVHQGGRKGHVHVRLPRPAPRAVREHPPADVRWICTQLDRLTDAQWQDAFRAGGYPGPIADRFIARLKQKIHEGLALKDCMPTHSTAPPRSLCLSSRCSAVTPSCSLAARRAGRDRAQTNSQGAADAHERAHAAPRDQRRAHCACRWRRCSARRWRCGPGAAGRRRVSRPSSRRRSSWRSSAPSSCWSSAPASRAPSASSAPPT